MRLRGLLAANVPLHTHCSKCPLCPQLGDLLRIACPLKPVKRDPLACVDVRSFAEEEYVMIDVSAPTMGSEAGEEKKPHTMQEWVS